MDEDKINLIIALITIVLSCALFSFLIMRKPKSKNENDDALSKLSSNENLCALEGLAAT